MSEPTIHEGGCLCGAVRYCATGAPDWVAHCHCQSCRRNSGAAVLTYAGFTRAAFAYSDGEPAAYNSSPGVTRRFCANCGTPLTYEAEHYPDEVHVTVGSLDRPERLPATVHVWTRDRIPWLDMADGLPRHHETARGAEPAG